MFENQSECLRFIELADENLKIQLLRENICLDEFGELLLSMPNSKYPLLSQMLPKMPSDDMQKLWAGSSGYPLLKQSITFIRVVALSYILITGKQLRDATVLDYGCGFGRLLRLFNYYVDNNKLYGCDPWGKAIEACLDSKLRCKVDLIDFAPSALPYESHYFDFIYAFSVFTHTAEYVTRSALMALHRVLKKDGLLAITIRPIEYWDFDKRYSEIQRSKLKRDYFESGYSFQPHVGSELQSYGDTVMSLNYLSSIPEFRIVKCERTIDDYYQRVVYLQAK